MPDSSNSFPAPWEWLSTGICRYTPAATAFGFLHFVEFYKIVLKNKLKVIGQYSLNIYTI